MRTHPAIVLGFIFSLAGMLFVPASLSQSKNTQKDTQKDAPHLVFVRQLSSGRDIKHEHPILNRSLDIVAGKKDPETPNYELQEPRGVTTDSMHRVFVTDLRAKAVHVFDFVNAKYSRLHGGDLQSPVGVAADSDGNIYVSDSGLQSILVYDARGKFVRHLKRAKGSESYFDSVQGIAIDPVTRRIYACDRTRHLVFALDRSGRVLARFGKRFGGDGPGEFRFPTQVAATSSEIVVLDSGNYRVQILDARGRFLRQIGLPGASIEAGLALDGDTNIYVTDPHLNRLQVFSHSGQFLYQFGEPGTGAGQFNGISGVWVDSGHCLYVADSMNKRVQLFQIAGANAGGC